MNDFWFNNSSILINSDSLIDFFPSKHNSISENLNSIVRFCMYASLIMVLYKKDINWISIFIFSLIFTYYISISVSGVSKEHLENTQNVNDCRKPTLDNPFMNFTMNPNIDGNQKACKITDLDISKQVDEKFNNNLFKDVDDLSNNSQRQFFTMPWTESIPDINGDFKNWLYKTPVTCKDNQEFCADGNYNDLRAVAFKNY